MRSIQITLLALFVCAGCNQTPSSPTEPPPPDPPQLSCPGPVTASAPTSQGVTIEYDVPRSQNGQGPVNVACSPESGTLFPVGTTDVECVATDSLSRRDSCMFSVTVAGPPRLSRTRIMAFGDSVTYGVTVVSNDPYDLASPPGVSYPSVLQRLLSERYTDQSIVVSNQGLPGELVSNALWRFNYVYNAEMPEVVILHQGYNDFHRSGDQIRGIDNVLTGMWTLTTEAKRRGARVFVTTLAPSRPGRIGIPTSALEYMNDRLRQMARSEGAALIDIYQALLPDVNGNVSIDGLHLTPLGYRRFAEAVFAAIRDDLEIR